MENPIFPNLGTFLVQLFSFLLVVYILNKLLYAPISKILEERARKIKDAIDTAENTRIEAERLLREHKEYLEQAKLDAQKIKDQAMQVAAGIREEAVTKAREQADRIVMQTRSEVEKEKIKAMEEIRGRVADLVILAASKVAEKSLTRDDHLGLIDEYVQSLSEVNSGKES